MAQMAQQTAQQAPPHQLLYDEYAQYTQTHKALYGPDTVVLMEVGSFLEFYDCDRGLGADVPRVCGLLNIAVTRKSKAIPTVSRSNPMMGGFPRAAAPKHVQVLVDAGFTVVYVAQVSPPPNPRRAVTEIVSAATSAASDLLSPPADGDTAASASAASSAASAAVAGSALMAAHVESGAGWAAVGWAVLDLATGRTRAGECVADKRDLTQPLEALRRAAIDAAPIEVVVSFSSSSGSGSGSGGSPPSDPMDDICAHLAGVPRARVHRREPSPSAQHRDDVLRKAFPVTGFLTPAEHVDLERRPYALEAFVAALQFAHEHNDSVVRRVQRPDLDTDADGVELMMQTSADALQQLDVVGPCVASHSSHSSRHGRGHGPGQHTGPITLLRCLNRCRTAVGTRAFRDRLLRPITCRATLEARYDAVDRLLACPLAVRNALTQALNGVGDLERTFRRVCLRRTSAAELPGVVSAFVAARDALLASPASSSEAAADGIVKLILSRTQFPDQQTMQTMQPMQPHQMQRSFFVRGVHPDVDAAQDELDSARAVFHQVAAALNAAMGAEHVRVVDDAMLVVTDKRWAAAVKSGAVARAAVAPWFCGADASLLAHHESGLGGSGNNRRVAHPALGPAAGERVARAAATLSAALNRRLAELLDDLAENYGEAAWSVVRAVEALDVALTCAVNAEAMGHVRPRFVQPPPPDGRSCVRAKGLRHPIIESLLLDRGERYVPNDVSLGCDGVGGILLYGVNAVGKSSVMKAIGLAVVMAQAGMFAACDALELAPFASLFTRIGLHDDLARGHSTFVVEMLELRSILRRADARSLVIGDELCAGTEAPSAISIVGAGVAALAERGTAFVFATHLHELALVWGGTPAPTGRGEERRDERRDERRGEERRDERRDETRGEERRDEMREERRGEERSGEDTVRDRRQPLAVSSPPFSSPRLSSPLPVGAGVPPPTFMHLSVHTDAATGRLVLNRKLQPGCGPPTYGLEVCRSLDMGDAFLAAADRIRRWVLGVPDALVPARASRYNAGVTVDRCGVCGAAAEETHHIEPQATAPSHVRHRRHNLAPLCGRCHDRVHAGEIVIDRYATTSDGVRLLVGVGVGAAAVSAVSAVAAASVE
jgi:DNA mismatch repair protein MutS